MNKVEEADGRPQGDAVWEINILLMKWSIKLWLSVFFIVGKHLSIFKITRL
jgi:hypothetical protein